MRFANGYGENHVPASEIKLNLSWGIRLNNVWYQVHWAVNEAGRNQERSIREKRSFPRLRVAPNSMQYEVSNIE